MGGSLPRAVLVAGALADGGVVLACGGAGCSLPEEGLAEEAARQELVAADTCWCQVERWTTEGLWSAEAWWPAEVEIANAKACWSAEACLATEAKVVRCSKCFRFPQGIVAVAIFTFCWETRNQIE